MKKLIKNLLGVRQFIFLCLGVREHKKVGDRCSKQLLSWNWFSTDLVFCLKRLLPKVLKSSAFSHIKLRHCGLLQWHWNLVNNAQTQNNSIFSRNSSFFSYLVYNAFLYNLSTFFGLLWRCKNSSNLSLLKTTKQSLLL